MTIEPAIRWPHAFDPVRSPVHVVNRLDLAAPPAGVWARLIRAGAWPDWYANAAKVKIEGGGTDLFAGANFTWRTFGVDLASEVEEFVPGERIAWIAKASGVTAYHAWLITPTDLGCRVLTEETQHGVLARLGRVVFPGRMERWHQRWLEGLGG
jgi:hypothetical protein